MTRQEVLDALQTRLTQEYNDNRTLYDAMKKDQADAIAQGRVYPDELNPIKSDTPVSVDAPPVTTPEKTKSVQTIPLSDGTTETRTTKEKTTVTPTTTGTTQGDTKTTFPTQTTSTVTTTNNTTNVTNTTTTVTNEAPQTPDKPVDPCDAHPDRAGCVSLGTPPPAEDIPKQDIPVSVTPVVFASSASCPAPITYNLFGARSMSYQPVCDLAIYLRPLILAFGTFACAVIFMDAFKL
jgi:hypothetical protein